MIFSAIMDIQSGRSIDSGIFIAYTTYIGGPATISISFYSWKAKAENLLKIHYSNIDKLKEAPIDISTLTNIGGS